MSAQTFAAIEAGGYAVAAVLLMVTVIYFFTRRVSAVRDELTGRAARKAIEELRAGGSSRPSGRAARGRGQDASGSALESGSLHVRFAGRTSSRMATTGARRTRGLKDSPTTRAVAQTETTTSAAAVAPSESGTTLLAEAPSELGTTLLSPADEAPSESGTTLLSPADEALSESGTTLLGGGEHVR